MKRPENVQRKGSLGHILVVGSGGALAQGITVLSTPVITRLYTPESYATWAIVMSIVALVGVAATLRYELAIVLPNEHEEGAQLFALSVSLALFVAAVMYALLDFCGRPMGLLVGLTDLGQWKFWIPLLITCTALTQACNAWCTRMRGFTALASAGITLSLVTAAGQAGAALLWRNDASGLIAGTVLGQTASVLVIACTILAKEGNAIAKAVSFQSLIAVAKKYRNYPMFMTPFTLVGVARERVVLFFLNSSAPRADVGYYAFSARMVQLPVNLVSSAIRPVLFQRAAANRSTDLETFLTHLLSLLTRITTPFWVFFLFKAPFLFGVAFGPSWRDASMYGRILAIPGYAQLLATWMDRMMDVLGRQALALKMETTFSFVSVACFALGLLIFKNVMVAVAMQASVLLIYNLFWIYLVFRLCKFDTKKLGRVALSFLNLCALFGVAMFVLQQTVSELVGMGIYLTGALVYLGLVLRGELRSARLNPTAA